MKKKILAALLAVAVVCSMAGCGNKEEERKENTTESVAETESEKGKKEYRDTDFRNAKWGDDMNTVKKSEDAEVFGGNDNMLMYKLDISGQEGKVMYVFDDSGLYSVVYDITNDELSASEWMDYYEKLKNDLAERYDEPAEDSVIALNGDKTDADPELLKEGKISLQTGWVNDKVNIWMQLMADDEDHFFVSVVAINPKVAMGTLASDVDEQSPAETESVVEAESIVEAESVVESVEPENEAIAEEDVVSEITDAVPEIAESDAVEK